MTKKIRQIRVDGKIAFVPLTKGYEAVIDVEDIELVNLWSWQADIVKRKNGSILTVYAVRSGSSKIRMHRILMNAPKKVFVDHIDGDGLNNRRRGNNGNLRFASASQNNHNARLRSDNTSGVKGVCFDKETGKWLCQIMLNRKPYKIGRFETKNEAVAAIEDARSKMHGKFARSE